MQWLLGIALAAAVFIILKQWAALSQEKKKAATWKIVLVVAGALLLFMVLTGRVHVLTAAVAALLPLLRKLPALLKFLPFIKKVAGQQQNQSGAKGEGASGRQSAHGGMSVQEACDTLGVKPNCTRDEVIQAHRRLIQKLHPDRGGNDYLAAKINEAKQVLLDQTSDHQA